MARVQTDISMFIDGEVVVRTYEASYHHTITLSSSEYGRDLTLYFTKKGEDRVSIDSVTEFIEALRAIRASLEASDDG